MTAVNLRMEISRYEKQRKKIEEEIRGLEKKKKDQVAKIDQQIDTKREQIVSINRCLNKVNRLQEQMAQLLGVNIKKPVSNQDNNEKIKQNADMKTEDNIVTKGDDIVDLNHIDVPPQKEENMIFDDFFTEKLNNDWISRFRNDDSQQ